jgi:hypothetical protein
MPIFFLLTSYNDQKGMYMNIKYLGLIFSSLLITVTSDAHNGRKDKQGGHYDTKAGIYHCHASGCVKKKNKKPKYSNSSKIYSANKKTVKAATNERVSASQGEYNRKDWPHWIDLDRDCQDSRAEAFIALSSTPVKFKRNKGCNVSHGTFYGAYTNKTYTVAKDLDLDHIVPLYDAHHTGGYAWTRDKRRAFANDPLNLLPVDLSENRRKGGKSPMEYMPPYKPYHCEYVTRWIDIKKKYGLEIRTGVIRMKQNLCK